LRETFRVQACFLLGPAGSGKTFRCLTEIRDALAASPEGAPLILLAPKQATFQLERQLLAGSSLAGYTRLRILSFERLAEFVFDALRIAPPRLLSEEGRVMVLRALLMQRRSELRLFDKSARSPGFAQQLSLLLRELQCHQFTPQKLAALSQREKLRPELKAKLHDLALLLEAYLAWLREHELQNANRLLDAATEALKGSPKSKVQIAGLWLDGFAEMTPQELDLLAAIVSFSERATLAFCLEDEPKADASWLSIWSVIGRTFRECHNRLAALPNVRASVEILPRDAVKNRFAGNPFLRHLEEKWTKPEPFLGGTDSTPSPKSSARKNGDEVELVPTRLKGSLCIVTCANPEAEAVFAAREILQFVRGGGRYREAAVLVRQLDGYHKPLARVFRRYEIPFFLDRRESVSHHPLAELTRSALRTVALDWPHEDWFAALKTGFAPVDETEIDRLENEALERGWRGARWQQPIQIIENPTLAESLERLRRKIVPPFQELATELARFHNTPSGAQLAAAIRGLWKDLDAEETLAQWGLAELEAAPGGRPQSPIANRKSQIHLTVWDQMNAWLDNLELGFPHETLSLREWLPILEAGLANLTVGVIPPALDQVLIGAIDRSRNPDLKLALVLGLNESVFPAAPDAPTILNDADRAELRGRDASLGSDVRDRLAQERYYGYIACTRARQRLVLTYARHDANGKTLNPSPLVSHLRQLFPDLDEENFPATADWREAEHASELAALLIEMQKSEGRKQNWADLLELPALARLNDSLRQLRNPNPNEGLSGELAEKIHGPVLHTSVSRMEQFAACPFRFFIHSGLRAEERKLFELDVREQGSFQHDVLARFHEQLHDEGKRWRDIVLEDARERVGNIAAAMTASYRDGLLQSNEQSRFTARVLTEALQDFVETIVGWMREQYDFDPVAVELAFGGKDARNAAWELDLGTGRRLALQGRIDRVDLFREAGRDDALCVVIDYKSSRKQLDPVLVAHGVQLQLLAYLSTLRHWPDPRPLFGATRLIPAGVFYVNLRGKYERSENRAEALVDVDAARKLAYRHTGRFDASVLRKLDRRPDVKQGDQFNYRLNKDGSLRGNSAEALGRAEFAKLLDRVEAQLREMGRAIFSGAASVDPYRKGKTTACDQCDYRAICRIDPWTHRYRMLRAAEEEAQVEL
jgi:ATP-dependent helicase/nuclease subunit B